MHLTRVAVQPVLQHKGKGKINIKKNQSVYVCVYICSKVRRSKQPFCRRLRRRRAEKQHLINHFALSIVYYFRNKVCLYARARVTIYRELLRQRVTQRMKWWICGPGPFIWHNNNNNNERSNFQSSALIAHHRPPCSAAVNVQNFHFFFHLAMCAMVEMFCPKV